MNALKKIIKSTRAGENLFSLYDSGFIIGEGQKMNSQTLAAIQIVLRAAACAFAIPVFIMEKCGEQK